MIRDLWASGCEAQGIAVPEAHITHVPPLIPTLYADLKMVCPHGITWHMQPTSEQMAKWTADGTE